MMAIHTGSLTLQQQHLEERASSMEVQPSKHNGLQQQRACMMFEKLPSQKHMLNFQSLWH